MKKTKTTLQKLAKYFRERASFWHREAYMLEGKVFKHDQQSQDIFKGRSDGWNSAAQKVDMAVAEIDSKLRRLRKSSCPEGKHLGKCQCSNW